jgi:ATP-dependent RNA helicase RhlE
VLAKLPRKKQTLFFSATMPPAIVKLADSILYNPVKVEVTPVSSTADTIQQSVYFVDKTNKKALLMEILKNPAMKSVLVFTRTKHGADRVARDLGKHGFKAAAIHGDKSQNARQHALNDFKTGKLRTLIATDIAARGIDVDNLSHVINYEMPNVPETYVHRIGRTGRAGANGVAYSFCDAEEKEYLRDIQKLIGKSIPVVTDHRYPMQHTTAQPKPKQDDNRGRHSRADKPKREHKAPRPKNNNDKQDRKDKPNNQAKPANAKSRPFRRNKNKGKGDSGSR